MNKTCASTFLIVLLSVVFSGLSAEQTKLSFNRDIRPILSENCYLCHGFDKKKRKGDLRLDTFEGATLLKKGVAAIVPGRPDQSNLMHRIETDDLDDLMPPADSMYKLTKKEIETLRTWITQGAEYEDHWAYLPVNKPGSKSIDQHIDETLKKESIEKSRSRPTPRTLIRRLSYDLRGLPPNLKRRKPLLPIQVINILSK